MHAVDQQLAQFAKGRKNNRDIAQTAVMYTRVSTKSRGKQPYIELLVFLLILNSIWLATTQPFSFIEG
jgi:hypothetical protein